MDYAQDQSRRQFLRVGTLTGGGVFVAGLAATARTAEPAKGGQQAPEDVAPPEDLMREHGVLNRILLIYDEQLRRLRGRGNPELKVLSGAAKIIRTFIEDYHEKLEEDHLFPLFEKAGKLVELVKVLRQQHQAGRRLTEEVTRLAVPAAIDDAQGKRRLCQTLEQFNRMYRPHEAREDTVLFPALRSLMTAKQFDAMGDRFEEKEHQLFGPHGFEDIVARVAEFEKKLGIYDLAQFTPKT
jgi:hemerythrin-like domain-containing protein